MNTTWSIGRSRSYTPQSSLSRLQFIFYFRGIYPHIHRLISVVKIVTSD
jgi:hypothetical protein